MTRLNPMTSGTIRPFPTPPKGVKGRRLKICLASRAPFLSGAEVAAERLALGLLQAGHEVFLVLGTRGTVLERMERGGLRCLHAPMALTDKWHWWRWLRGRQALRRLLGRERPDVLHSNDLPTHQALSGAAWGLPIPRICHHRFPYGRAAIEWFNKYGAERHLFVSRALMDEMCTNSERLHRSACSVVHDGLPLPPPPTDEARQRTRRQLGLPVDRLIVIFAGQVIAPKGVADLIDAWSGLDPRLTQQSELLIVGDDLQAQGGYRRAMQRLASARRCAARFVGFQPNVGEWLLASDVAVVPSHVEPLGLANLEAMSYALPVIGCAVGGIPEIIVHGQTGELIPPRAPRHLAAALTRLLADRETRLHYGREGRRRCEELFNLQLSVRRVLEEYRRVVTW